MSKHVQLVLTVVRTSPRCAGAAPIESASWFGDQLKCDFGDECAIACLSTKIVIHFEVFGLRAHKVFVYFTCLNLSKREHVILSRPSGQ
jgi:hypothetical protein